MYGTRDAAQNWESEYVNFIEGLGFKSSKCSPCLFYHEDDQIHVVVHGDDFIVLGYEEK